jgi:putative nucleotidyltransferase with HDIG domain
LPDRCQAFFIHPVDIPLVRPRTVQRLAATIKDHPADVLYPTFDGRRGHPTLIRTRLVPSILRWAGDGGLKACLRRHEADGFELPVVDEATLLDLDTPGDYDRMLARLTTQGLPSDAECRVLMEQIQRLPSPIAEHCRTVSEVARRLAGALAAAGSEIDIELVRTAALLHDIARTGKNHAQAGARLLLEHGFDRLAPIVGAHMDLDVRPDLPMDAAQVVFLADKVVEGERYEDLDRRFGEKLERFGGDRNVAEAIRRRWENARLIRDKVEKMTGRSIEAIIAERNPEG